MNCNLSFHCLFDCNLSILSILETKAFEHQSDVTMDQYGSTQVVDTSLWSLGTTICSRLFQQESGWRQIVPINGTGIEDGIWSHKAFTFSKNVQGHQGCTETHSSHQ